MRVLYRSPHFVVTVDNELRLLRRTRSDAAFESITEIEIEYDAIIRASELLGHARLVLLTDMRLAPPRNDPAFEEVIQRYMLRLSHGFRRSALIARTEVGRLQITRHLRDNAAPGRVFLDEAAAIAYLLESERCRR